MFDFSFSFAAALFALPLAAAPVLLHLLFKQKSPIVQFSTLRFIKMSIQQTAARKKVQKWLLLACRALLVALIIWAIAQPVHQLTSSWLGGGDRSMIAAIVVDTSYSMQLQDSAGGAGGQGGQGGQETLLSRADAMVQDLLRNQLASAKVAIFKSLPDPPDHPAQLQQASALVAEWIPFTPQPSPRPLFDRVANAVNFLANQPADQKWLVVISDFQTREFGQTLPSLPDGRTVLLDLHPADPRSAGITQITLNPAQPIPGIPLVANVQVTGQTGDSRAVAFKIQTTGGDPISESAPAMETLDSSGRTSVQFPIKLHAQQWMLLTASLTEGDAMAWDNQRTQLIQVPPRQHVAVMQMSPGSAAERVLALALDPSEGSLTEWPLAVSKVTLPAAADDVVVVPLPHWPTARQANALRNFAASGRTVVLFLTPGLERTWPTLSTQVQQAMTALLPSAPLQRPGSTLCRAAVADAADPLLTGLTDEKYQLSAIVVRQLVPLAADGESTTILNAVPADPDMGSQPQGLLFRKPVGRGICFTCATLPDSQFTNLATHPTFLPLLVRMALKSPEQNAEQNVELGQPLVLDGQRFASQDEILMVGPHHEQYRVPAVQTDTGRQFIFNQADQPGLYQWQTATDSPPVAMANVQLPASESDLTYRTAQSVAPPGPNTIIATSMTDLSSKVASLTAAQPQWSTPLAIVMFLLCLEALMGSWSKMRKPAAPRAFMPDIKAEVPVAG